MAMKREDAQRVNDRIKQDGLNYTLMFYSNFSEIEDEKFHQLRSAFLKSVVEFQEYLVEGLNS